MASVARRNLNMSQTSLTGSALIRYLGTSDTWAGQLDRPSHVAHCGCAAFACRLGEVVQRILSFFENSDTKSETCEVGSGWTGTIPWVR